MNKAKERAKRIAELFDYRQPFNKEERLELVEGHITSFSQEQEGRIKELEALLEKLVTHCVDDVMAEKIKSVLT